MNTYKSGTKPRYDGAGTEFGDMHRELPPHMGMFDIDRMSAIATVNLEIVKQNVGFIEYRTDFGNGTIKWQALFEVKHHWGITSQKAMEFKIGTASWAQLRMAIDLGCRYFFVIASDGKQPFEFFEIFNDGKYETKGILNYDETNRQSNVTEFWKHNLGLY